MAARSVEGMSLGGLVKMIHLNSYALNNQKKHYLLILVQHNKLILVKHNRLILIRQLWQHLQRN